MNTERILQALKFELARIQNAITALESTHSGSTNGRRKGQKRRMSAAARKKISQAQKKRWAAQRKH